MDIKLDHYKIFFEVANNLSFSRAAEQLFITQSAVSQSVRHLESQLDTRLFIRGKKGVSLTPEGELLYEYIKNAIFLIDKGEREIQKIKNLETGNLRIGVSDTISRYLLLPYLEKFNRTYPMVNLQIVNRTSIQAVDLLKSGQVDLAFINLPLTDDAIEMERYGDVQDIFVAGSRFRFLYGRAVTLRELADYPLIFLEKNSNTRNYVENFFLSKGIQLTPEIELGSHDLVLEFARINLGIACVTQEFSRQYLTDDTLHKIDVTDPIPKRGIGICKLKGVSVSAAGNAFLKLMRKERPSSALF